MAEDQRRAGGRGLSRRLLGSFFLAAGVNHFLMPRAYERIVPPALRPRATLAVQLSGVAEIAGGVGVLVPATRRLSGFGLITLLAAVFPANLHMARAPESFPRVPRWALYARLPLQPLMMLWAWRATRPGPPAAIAAMGVEPAAPAPAPVA
ncbi:MAG TPA: DoxX family membrane protein [Solirubrobacteraceae bacterium]|nr:DoxX family membrane protein [Solirubrobacteraceae bacterium]